MWHIDETTSWCNFRHGTIRHDDLYPWTVHLNDATRQDTTWLRDKEGTAQPHDTTDNTTSRCKAISRHNLSTQQTDGAQHELTARRFHDMTQRHNKPQYYLTIRNNCFDNTTQPFTTRHGHDTMRQNTYLWLTVKDNSIPQAAPTDNAAAVTENWKMSEAANDDGVHIKECVSDGYYYSLSSYVVFLSRLVL